MTHREMQEASLWQIFLKKLVFRACHEAQAVFTVYETPVKAATIKAHSHHGSLYTITNSAKMNTDRPATQAVRKVEHRPINRKDAGRIGFSRVSGCVGAT